jgi:signal transduction histidine kinase
MVNKVIEQPASSPSVLDTKKKPLEKSPQPLSLPRLVIINPRQQVSALESGLAQYLPMMEQLSAVEIGMNITGGDRKILLQNQFLESRFGSASGKYCYQQYRNLHHLCKHCPMVETLHNGTVCSCKITASDERCYEMTFQPLRNPGGAIEGVINITRDITEEQKKDEEYQLKCELLAMAVHELRQPLTALKMYSSVLLNYFDRIDNDEKKSFLKDIDISIDRLKTITGDLTDFSRLEGSLCLNKTHVNISGLLTDITREIVLTSGNHYISLDICEPLTGISVDDNRIRQVIVNLVQNAINYSPEKTTISIRAYQITNYLIVSVRDNGIGIPADEIPNIFHRYYRTQQGVDSYASGQGLGLYICQQIIKAHGGKIWVESEPGRGSNFLFSLPIS